MSLHTRNLLKALSPETVKSMVKSELETYDADKTGRTDYALESAGFAEINALFLLCALSLSLSFKVDGTILHTKLYLRRRFDPLDTRHRALLDRRPGAQPIRHTALSAAEHTAGCNTGYLL